VREVLLERIQQRLHLVLDPGSPRACFDRLVQFLRQPVQVAVLGIDLGQKHGVRLRPFEELHNTILP